MLPQRKHGLRNPHWYERLSPRLFRQFLAAGFSLRMEGHSQMLPYSSAYGDRCEARLFYLTQPVC